MPEVDARTLTEEERIRVQLWFAPARAWVRGYGAFLVSLLPIWIATSAYLAFRDHRSGLEASPVLTVLASFGVFVAASGTVSGVAEIVMGFSKRVRWVFVVLALLVAATFVLQVRDPELRFLFGTSAVVFVLVGLTLMGLRILRGRRTRKLLRQVDESLRQGEVARFAKGPNTLDALVPVGLALEANGEAIEQPILFFVDRLAGPTEPPPSAPLRGFEAVGSTSGFELRQRHLTEAEASEIRQIIKRWARRLVVLVPMAALGVWQLANLAMGGVPDDLGKENRPEAWIVAVASTLFLLAGSIHRLWLLERDADGGLVVVLMQTDHDSEQSLEQLPTSGTVWTVNGAPAPWRGWALSLGPMDL